LAGEAAADQADSSTERLSIQAANVGMDGGSIQPPSPHLSEESCPYPWLLLAVADRSVAAGAAEPESEAALPGEEIEDADFFPIHITTGIFSRVSLIRAPVPIRACPALV